MTNTEFSKISVLITRPKHQAEELSQMIEAIDCEPIRFPTIEIEPLQLDEAFRMESFHTLIFVSRNAVDCALQNWSVDVFNGKQIIAIGSATASALETAGIAHVIRGVGQASSEQLLELEALQEEQVADKAILILRGVGGRDNLVEGLRSRGAKIDYIELYERLRPCYDQAEIQRVWHENKPEVIILTSNEALDNLEAIMHSSAYRDELFKSDTVVMSERMSRHAKQLGFTKKSFVASETSNQGLMNALARCLNEVKHERRN